MITPKKQIVIQDIIKQLVDGLPEFKINNTNTKKATFSFGNESEINRYIKSTSGKIYPLIWLLPSKIDNNIKSNIANSRVSIIVATLENKIDKFNQKRYEDSFKQTLFPVRDYLVHSLDNSGATNIVGGDVSTYEFPNYVKEDKSISINNWDAIRIECEVDFIRDKCIKSFTWTV